MAINAAKQLMEAADFTDPDSLDEIGSTIRFTAAGEWASRELLASASSRDTLWAAVWVYASAGSDPAPLRPLLSNDDYSIRVLAAACLTSLGDASGFAVLQEALADDRRLLGSEPPLSIQLFAVQTLEGYVAADTMPAPAETEEENSANLSAWTAWLSVNAAILQFDQATGAWVL